MNGIEKRATVRELAELYKQEFGASALSAAQLASHLGLHPQTVRRLIDAGKLPGHKINGHCVCPVTSLAIWEVNGAKV